MNTTRERSSKWPIWIVVTIFAVAAIAAFMWKKTGPAPEESVNILIGAVLPLTGDAAEYGKNDRQGIDLAVSLVNESGGIGGRMVEVRYEDCQTDGKKALAAFNKLRAEGVSLFINDAISTVSLAMAPILEQNKSVLISTGASNPSLSGISPWFFRIWNSDAFEGRIAADYLKATAPTAKVAVLYVNNDYGQGLQRVLGEELKGSQIQLVTRDSFDAGTGDFRTQVAKIQAAAPSHIYLIGYAAQTGPATRQIREAGITAQIVGTVAMEDPGFLSLAGTSSNGVVYPFPKASEGAAVERFKTAFRAKFAKEPALLNDCGYDAANLLLEAFRKGAVTPLDVRDSLSKVKGFPGASGEISFDSNGDVSKPMEIKVIKDGKFTQLPITR